MVNVKTNRFKGLYRGITIMLAAILILSGCSTKKSETQSPSPNVNQASPKVTTELKKQDLVDLSWYMLKPIDNEKDQAVVEAEANKTINEKINANLHFNFLDNASWNDKMRLMSASGEAYDLVFTAAWTNNLDLNVQRGAFLPLNDLLQKYGQEILKRVDKRAWDAVTYNGQIMAVPGEGPWTQPLGNVFKKDLVEKYNFDYKNAKTIKELEPFLANIKKNEPNITPLLVTAGTTVAGNYLFGYTGLIKGVLYDEKAGKLALEIELPEYQSNIRIIHEYYEKGYIAKDAAIKTDYTAEAKSGKYAVMRDSGGYTEDGSKSTALYGFPTVESLVGYPLIQTGSITSASTAISKTSKNPERAMQLLNLIWQDEKLTNTLAYGTEGKNYKITSGAGTDNPTVVANSGAEQTWAIWHNFLGPLWSQWDSNWNSTASLKQMQDNNNNAKASAVVGFVFNVDPVKSEVAQVSAVYKEATPIINSGSMTEFDAFLAELKQKLKTAGIDKIKDEAQKQLDAWKAKNK